MKRCMVGRDRSAAKHKVNLVELDCKPVRPHHTSLHGILEGKLRVVEVGAVSIGIISRSIPFWALNLAGTGCVISWIYSQVDADGPDRHLLERLFPQIPVVYGESSTLTSVPAATAVIVGDASFCIGNLPQNTVQVHLFPPKTYTNLVVGQHFRAKLVHSKVGGATTSTIKPLISGIPVKKLRWLEAFTHPVPTLPMCVGSHVDFGAPVSHEHARLNALPPFKARPTSSSGQALWCPIHRCYRLEGAFPMHGKPPSFGVRSPFSPTGFVRRRLTLKELFSVLDVSDHHWKHLSVRQQRGMVDELRIPCKLVSHILKLVVRLTATPRGSGGCAGGEVISRAGRVGDIATVEGRAGDIAPIGRGVRAGGAGVEQVSRTDKAEDTAHIVKGDTQEATMEVGDDIRAEAASGKDTSVSLEEEEVKVMTDECRLKRNQVAVKHDDAPIPEYLWDEALVEFKGLSLPPNWERLVATLRQKLLARWKRNVRTSFFTWLKSHFAAIGQYKPEKCVKWNGQQYEWSSWSGYHGDWKFVRSHAPDSMAAARDCIGRAAHASWWKWDEGSRPFFWRYKEEFMVDLRDGVQPWLNGKMPKYKAKRIHFASKEDKEKVKKKCNKVRKLQYVNKGPIDSEIDVFHVPKGEDDIRLVYHGTSCGLSDVLWAPWFAVPTVGTTHRAIIPGTISGDSDVGDMFHNFMMHKSLQPFVGVNFRALEEPEAEVPIWDISTSGVGKMSRCGERFGRSCMGITNSPYNSTQSMHRAEETIYGEREILDNPFSFEKVELNLPGDPTYNPGLPWVCKKDKKGNIASDIFSYIDDQRITGANRLTCWGAMQRNAQMLSFLGLQSAARKRRDIGTDIGAWAGSIISTSNGKVLQGVPPDKWLKAQRIVRKLKEELEKNVLLDHLQCQKDRGFLIYVSRAYKSMVPYLKGLHQTIDAWRPWRKDDGWKMERLEMEEILHKGEVPEGWLMKNLDPPKTVMPVQRMKMDFQVLSEFMEDDTPPMIKIRCSKHATVWYGGGDASGRGFGSALDKLTGEINIRRGEWNLNIQEDSSSNYRELCNLVEMLEEEVEKVLAEANGTELDLEIFIFTDNSVTEYAFYKGNSTSKKLFELVKRLRKLELRSGIILHVIHIAGTRMQACGIDGLSRGDDTKGVMLGEKLMSFVPLNLSAFAREERLKPWFETVFGSQSVKFLEPIDWFGTLEDVKVLNIWSPPPGAAFDCVEMMTKAIHKRPYTSHCFVCPCLMTSRWRKQVSKATDILVKIPTGSKLWKTNQHEDLFLFIYLPLSNSAPWRWKRRCSEMGELERLLPPMFSENINLAGDLLRKLLDQAWDLQAMPKRMVS